MRYKNPALVVDRAGAEGSVRALHRAGLLDPTRKIVSAERVTIPVRPSEALDEWARRLDADLVEEPDLPPREGRVAPREQVLRRLEGRLDPALLARVPDKWEQLGEVLVVRLPPELLPHAREVGEAFGEALGVRAMVNDAAGVSGELREMRGALVWGDDSEAVHVENGIRYRFDAARIMFSSGNVAERMRAASIPARGEVVIDMFAGIGYFTLPLAKHAAPAKVHALEKNPLSHRYLRRNVEENGLADVVAPWLGDNRDFPREGEADRVLMGYFPRTEAFLPKALRLLKPGGGTLYYHNTAHAERWRDELEAQARAACAAAGRSVDVAEARVVKTHSPGVVHAALVLRVR